jgi:glucose/arabinose dehydrogenase
VRGVHAAGRDSGCKRRGSRPCALGMTALAAAAIATGCGSSDPGGGLVPVGAGLRAPKGLAATVYATGLRNASAFAFDRRGRLWVATSGATDHDTDALYLVSGRDARPVRVARLRGPLGLVWYRGELFVAETGRVEAFGALRGTRFTSRRTILAGPVRGASNAGIVAAGGRLLMSVLATCDHCKPASRWSAAIVSFRPDGSDLRVYASGIRAGYGLAYEPGTGDLLVSMNQRDDLGARTPGDWLALVRRGQDWGFPRCYGQGGRACRGAPRPHAVLDRHAAAGGVALLRGSAIVAEWQSGKVLRVSRTGSVTTFLTGLKNPLPVARAPGGALLVGDWSTGTIYRVA